MKVHVLRLRPAQDLKKELEDFATANAIRAGWIITCVGSLKQHHIRFANQRSGNTVEGFFEIVSLTGTIGIHGSHLHISLSDPIGTTIGGHLLEGNLVYTTAEIVLGESKEVRFEREIDPATGYKELIIKRNS